MQIWGRDTAFDRHITYVHFNIVPTPSEEETCRTILRGTHPSVDDMAMRRPLAEGRGSYHLR